MIEWSAMSKPYFSIVIDNYNYGRFIADAIESVLAQDFPAGEFELIVVDDGSTDDSVAVISRYKDKLTLLQQKNQEQVAAFANGFQAARGEVVCMLDSDDYWTADKLKAVAEPFIDEGIVGVQHYLRDVDASGRPLDNPLANWPPFYTLEDFAGGRFAPMATSGLAFRRRLLGQITPPKHDGRFIDEYMAANSLFFGSIANIRRILGYHRIHGNNFGAQRNRHLEQLAGHTRGLRSFHAHFEAKLKERGMKFSPRSKALAELEIRRHEILLAMSRGRRGEAFSFWLDMVKNFGSSPLGIFRSATCALILISPALYLSFYEWYGGRGNWPARVRQFFLPDPR